MEKNAAAEIATTADKTRLISPFAETVGSLAVEAMLYEVTCTPSPGLVDRVNSGAHTDMDFDTFVTSAKALRGYFGKCFSAGLHMQGQRQNEVLGELQNLGRSAELKMFSATNGVNTH